MKSLEEIQKMLVTELLSKLDEVRVASPLEYYNEVLGKTSFLLAGIIQLELERRIDDWDVKKWMDDCLLTKVEAENHELGIWGIIIWGVENTTDQWTDPFYFKITFDSDLKDFTKYEFLLGDVDIPSMRYESFNKSRGVWDKSYYSNSDWHPSERTWRYRIISHRTP